MPAPYIPDVNNTAEPISGRPAGTAAAEFRGIKALLATLAVAGLASSSVRQAIQSASLDANGYNNAITVGAGLRPGLSATATPYHLSYAAGFTAGKPSNLDEVIALDNADILAANLPLSNTSFLHKVWAGAYGNTLIPPQYGYAFDRTKQALLNFEGINGSVTTADDFGNVWTLTTGTITTAQFKYGASCFSSAGGYARTASINTFGDGSWELSLWFRVAALPGADSTIVMAGNAAGVGLALNLSPAGKIVSYLSSDGAAWNLYNANVGAATVVINQWHKVRFVFDALGGTYRVYVSLNGAAETQDATLASTARMCAVTSLTVGATNTGATPLTGFFDALRFLPCATNTSTEVPAAVAPTVTDYLITFLSIPQMKMFDVTAASIVAGVNPTLAAVNRLFLGEADTSAVAVTAVRNYQVRGMMTSEGNAVPVAATRTNFVTNMGVPPAQQRARLFLRCVTADQGYVVGETVSPMAEYTIGTTDGMHSPIFIKDKNNISVASGQSGLAATTAPGTTYGLLVPTNWRLGYEVSRAF